VLKNEIKACKTSENTKTRYGGCPTRRQTARCGLYMGGVICMCRYRHREGGLLPIGGTIIRVILYGCMGVGGFFYFFVANSPSKTTGQPDSYLTALRFGGKQAVTVLLPPPG